MRHLATVLLILFIATSVLATERAAVPTNPRAFTHDGESPGVDGSEYATVIETRDTTVFLDVAEFVGLLDPGYYFDDFAGLDWGTISGVDTYQFGPVNGYSYTVFVAGGVFSIPGAVSTNSPFDSMIITFDGDPVFAVGGDFLGTDFDGLPIPAMVIVTLNDGTEVQLELPAVFAGFISDIAITQLTIATTTTSPNVYLAFDNFYVGQGGAVAAAEATWGGVKTLYK